MAPRTANRATIAAQLLTLTLGLAVSDLTAQNATLTMSANRKPLGVPAKRNAAGGSTAASSSSPPTQLQPAGFFARLAARFRPKPKPAAPAIATLPPAQAASSPAASSDAAASVSTSSPSPPSPSVPCYLSLLYRDALHSLLSFLPISDLAHLLTTSHSWAQTGSAWSAGQAVLHLPSAYNAAQIAATTALLTAVSRSPLRLSIRTALADTGMRVCATLPLLCTSLPQLTRLSIYEIFIEATELALEEAAADRLAAYATGLPSAAMMHAASADSAFVVDGAFLASSSSAPGPCIRFPSSLHSLQINFGASPSATFPRMLRLILLACGRLPGLHSLTLNQLPRSIPDQVNLSGLSALRSLTNLSLQLHSPASNQIGVLRGLAGLKTLRLTGDCPSKLLLDLCAPGHSFARLECVELSMDYLRADDIAVLSTLPALTRLPPAAFDRSALEALHRIRGPLARLILQRAITAPPPAAAEPRKRRPSDDPALVSWRQEREVDAAWMIKEVLLPTTFLRSLASLELHHVQQWSPDLSIKLASRLSSLQVLVLDCIPSLQSLSFLSLIPSLEQLAVIMCGPSLWMHNSPELNSVLALRSLRHLHVCDDPADSPVAVPRWSAQLAVPSAVMPALRCFHYSCNQRRVDAEGSRKQISVHSSLHGECEESNDLARCCLPLDA